MNDMTWFTIFSTTGAALAIAIGVMFPALAMGRAISQALDALARRAGGEKSTMGTLFLVWILTRFLYPPILGVIDWRRDGIEKTLADARRIEAEATEIRRQNERHLAEWGEEKDAAQAGLLGELAGERE